LTPSRRAGAGSAQETVRLYMLACLQHSMRLASLSDSSALRERAVLIPLSLRRASHRLAAAMRPAAETQYQCRLRLPPASEASVAIIGGGLSGACLAAALGERGVCCTVFDTGKHGGAFCTLPPAHICSAYSGGGALH